MQILSTLLDWELVGISLNYSVLLTMSILFSLTSLEALFFKPRTSADHHLISYSSLASLLLPVLAKFAWFYILILSHLKACLW